jgi:hypothetical protein
VDNRLVHLYSVLKRRLGMYDAGVSGFMRWLDRGRGGRT